MGRISYRNYPVLELLEKGTLGRKNFRPSDGASEENIESVKNYTGVILANAPRPFKKLSAPFMASAGKVKKQLTKLLDEVGGTATTKYIDGDFVALVHHEIDVVSRAFTLCFVLLHKSGEVAMSGLINQNKDLEIREDVFISKGLLFDEHRKVIYTTAGKYIALHLFEKYAQVEIVESKARSKIHAHGCKYLNETDVDIEYLDSKWFTTLVNSKGFKVGGHFRLQPKKKDGEWTKELIWIEDFEKKGYNRKAGILNQTTEC